MSARFQVQTTGYDTMWPNGTGGQHESQNVAYAIGDCTRSLRITDYEGPALADEGGCPPTEARGIPRPSPLVSASLPVTARRQTQ